MKPYLDARSIPPGRRYRKSVIIALVSLIALAIVGAIGFSIGSKTNESPPRDDSLIRTGTVPMPEVVANLPGDYLGQSFERPEPTQRKTEPEPDAVAVEQTKREPQSEPPKKPLSKLQQMLEDRRLALLTESWEAADSGGGVDGISEKVKELRPQSAALDVINSNYSEFGIHKPVSPYILHETSIIPAIIYQGMNSDLPGGFTAMVRENVYDSVGDDEDHLLIPMGTRISCIYDSDQVFGQERIPFSCSRLIFPNGDSLKLGTMNGTDMQGYSGIADRVDHHWGRLIGGVLLGSLLTAGTNISYGDRDVVSETQRGVAGSTSRALDDLVQRNLGVEPTITVRQGARINIAVNKDLIMKPYEETKHENTL